jgi:predicted PolB exonuclease-like 3'-5' exonuclease
MADTAKDPHQPTAYLIVDTESVPDGQLLARVKYPQQELTAETAVAQAQAEARALSHSGSDFLPVTFQYPVAACVLRVGAHFQLQAVKCLDAPLYRPRKITEDFWKGLNSYRSRPGEPVQLVTFNGRGFDLPLLELAAFRYGVNGGAHFAQRFRGDGHLDLMDWMTNRGSIRMSGGLNLLSKLLGKPGKTDIQGDMVYQLYLASKLQEINDYCLADTLDTYFIFLRTRVMTGELSLEDEHVAVVNAKEWLKQKVAEIPAVERYLANWGDWSPWP